MLFHVVISSLIQSDKPTHPIVLYEYFLICIFTKIHEPFENEVNHVKPINRGDGGGGWLIIRPTLHPYGIFSYQIV